jgi:hypothetical protein
MSKTNRVVVIRIELHQHPLLLILPTNRLKETVMSFVNLTPHPVTLYGTGPEIPLIATFPPTGVVARLAETVTNSVKIGDFCLAEVALGDIEGLPDEDVDQLATYIVSMPLAMRAAAIGKYRHRGDLVYPYSQVRDANGRIVGCHALARIA